MIRDTDINRASAYAPILEMGGVLVTQMRGKEPETVEVTRITGDTVELFNLEKRRPFTTSLGNIVKGRIGKSQIINGVVRSEESVDSPEVPAGSIMDELPTDKFYLVPKGGEKPVPVIASGKDGNGDVILVDPKEGAKLLRVGVETLLSGGYPDLDIVPVPPKFNTLFVSDEEDEERRRRLKTLPDTHKKQDSYVVPLALQNPEPLRPESVNDLKSNPVKPGERVWLLTKPEKGQPASTMEAHYLGIVTLPPTEKGVPIDAAKFVVQMAQPDGDKMRMEAVVLRVPLEAMSPGKRKVAIMPQIQPQGISVGG